MKITITIDVTEPVSEAHQKHIKSLLEARLSSLVKEVYVIGPGTVLFYNYSYEWEGSENAAANVG